MTTPSKAAIEAATREVIYLAKQVTTLESFEVYSRAIIVILQALVDAETAGLRDYWEGKRASEADLLNTELRENYGSAAQVAPRDDWRPAFKALVDGAKHAERFQWKAAEARADRAVELARKLHEALANKVVHRETVADFRCDLCGNRWEAYKWGGPLEVHTPTCLASPDALRELETI